MFIWDYGQNKWSDFYNDIKNRDIYVFGAGAKVGRLGWKEST